MPAQARRQFLCSTMDFLRIHLMHRRSFLQQTALTCLGAALAPNAWSLAPNQWSYQLSAGPAKLQLVPGGATAGLGYNGQFPARVLRARQGELFRVEFTNHLRLKKFI